MNRLRESSLAADQSTRECLFLANFNRPALVGSWRQVNIESSGRVRRERTHEFHSPLLPIAAAPGIKRLLDHLVGAHQNGGWNLDAHRLGGFQVDDQFEMGRLLDRQIARLRALENLGNIDGQPAIHYREVWPVRQQATVASECPEWRDSGQAMRGQKFGNGLAGLVDQRGTQLYKRFGPFFQAGIERAVEPIRIVKFEDLKADPYRFRSGRDIRGSSLSLAPHA